MPNSDPFTALAYGPIVGERKRAQMIGAYDNPLGPQDVALSPDRFKDFPLRSWVQATDAQGNVLGKYRVADASYQGGGGEGGPGKIRPTTDTVEFRDRDISGQQIHLSPLGPGQVPGPGDVPPAMAMATSAAAGRPGIPQPRDDILQSVLANYGAGPAAAGQPAANPVADFLKFYYANLPQQRRRFG